MSSLRRSLRPLRLCGESCVANMLTAEAQRDAELARRLKSGSLLEHYADTEYCVIARPATAEIGIQITITFLKDRVVVGAKTKRCALRPADIHAAAKLHREVIFAAAHSRQKERIMQA